MPRQQELQRRDVPAQAAEQERALAELDAAERAEGGACLGGERRAGAGQLAEAGERPRPDVAVDVVVVQPETRQPHLERRHVGAAGRAGRRGDGNREGEGGEKRNRQSRAHALSIGWDGITL